MITKNRVPECYLEKTIIKKNIYDLVPQLVKNLPAVRETWVPSLGWEDPLEEGMATHSSILAWRIPMDGGAWQAAGHGVAKSRTRLSDLTFTFHFHAL